MSQTRPAGPGCDCSPASHTATEPPRTETGRNCCAPSAPAKVDEAGETCCPPAPAQEEPGCGPPQPVTQGAGQREAACCEPASANCCPPDEATQRRGWERPGHRLWHFVSGILPTVAGDVPQVSTRLTATDHFGRLQMRWGIGRDRYRIAPGLYAVGCPDADSEVLVSANYKLSFDMLRRELQGRDLWLLVLETYGVNVWCAAGKGTFGTEEIIRRAKATNLAQLVSHRRLIVPQLGAPGVAAHEVRRGCGFRVLYGPVRATDLPYFLDNGFRTSPEMRRVRFSILDRLVLTPVELTGLGKPTLYALLAVLLLGGIGPSVFSFGGMLQRGGGALLAFLAGLLSGAVVTPLLLPWLPWRAFALKGALVGAATALLTLLAWGPGLRAANGFSLLLAVPAISSWYAMNFTGSSTYTSPSGVEHEMRRAIPVQAAALLIAAAAWIWAAF